MNKFTFIVTKNNSYYVNWQTDILYSSFLEHYKDNKDFKFLALVAKDNGVVLNKKIFGKPVDPIYPHIYLEYTKSIKGDSYIVYNRILNLKQYLKTIVPSKDKFIILLDPDMVIIKPFDLHDKHSFTDNFVVAQVYGYLTGPKILPFFEKNFAKAENISDFYTPIGCPLIISEYLLSQIVDRWLELTIDLRTTNIEGSPFYNNWVCEMYGLSFALAEYQIKANGWQISAMPPHAIQRDEGYYFYHYCYDIDIKKCQNVFSKRSYLPWRLIDTKDISENDNQITINFLNLMNMYIKRKKKIEAIEKEAAQILTPEIITC